MAINIPYELQPASDQEKGRIAKALKWLEGIPKKRNSPKLTSIERKVCKFLVSLGYRQHDVAYAFHVNQGRINEAKKSNA